MNNTQKAILFILLSCFLILIRHYLIKYLYNNVSENKLPYLGIISLLIVLFSIYSIYISDKAKKTLTTTDSLTSEIKNNMINNLWYNEIIIYLNIVFLSIFAYMALNKNKNAWNVLLYQTIISLLSFGLFIKNKL
jgi:hypothetical protein